MVAGLCVYSSGLFCGRCARRTRSLAPTAATYNFKPLHRCKVGRGVRSRSRGWGCRAPGGGGRGHVGRVMSGDCHPSPAPIWLRCGSGSRPSPPPSAPPTSIEPSTWKFTLDIGAIVPNIGSRFLKIVGEHKHNPRLVARLEISSLDLGDTAYTCRSAAAISKANDRKRSISRALL